MKKGSKHSEDSKRKLSESRKGKYAGENHPLFGTHLSDETKQKISENRKGQCVGEKNPFYGKCHTEETKKRMSEAHKGEKHPFFGKHRPEDVRQKISDGRKGIVFSEEHKRKLREAAKRGDMGFLEGNTVNMGRKHTDATRRKMSVAHSAEKCHLWRGGISFGKYCPKFNNEFKERVRNYFGRCCYVCGKNEADNGKRLDVHHVNYQKMACCEEDVKPLFVPLCVSCHSKTHYDREYWEEFFTESLMFLTDGKCWYEKGEVETLENARIPKALYTLDDYI